MHNIWLIIRRDVPNLFRNVMSIIITVGLVVLPSLFAWYNILACWNVFDNTGNLSIAVASDDKGFTSDLVPIEVNVGDKVEAALRENDQINWVITDSDDAVEGTKSGKYYAALVIPAEFSSQMLNFYNDGATSANIRYYVNEKVNAISPNITGAGADAVSNQVNSVFAETVSEIAAALSKSFVQHADESGAKSEIAQLADHMREMSGRVVQTAEVLGMYSDLAGDSRGLLESSARLVESARSQAEKATSNSSGDKEAIRRLAKRLEAAVNELTTSLDSNAGILSKLKSRADGLLDDVSDDATTAAGKLRAQADKVDTQAGELEERLATLEELRDELHSGMSAEIDALYETDATEVEISEQIELIVERTVLLDKAISSLSRVVDLVNQTSSELNAAAESLEAGDADAKKKIASLRKAAAEAKSNIDSMKADFEETLKPGIDKLKTDLQSLATDLDAAAGKLGSAGSELPAAANKAGQALGNASDKVESAHDKLTSAAKEMDKLAESIDAALASGDNEVLRSLLAGSVDELATALSAPVQVERKALFPVENFGSAMAPLYSALALFIGSLLIMVATRPEVSERGRKELNNPKPRELYFGRFGVVALLSLMQTTVLSLGNMLLLQVQVENPLLYLLCFWVSGLVFAFMIYTMVVAFGNLGKALAVLLLIVQVTGCGGSYPLPIMPDFVQAISPWVPATHVVNALRAAMFGVYQNDFWISMGTLLLFVIPFLLLGLVLRKPLERFMRFYVSKVEESGLME